jgi:N4-gp56 family major capsid protein
MADWTVSASTMAESEAAQKWCLFAHAEARIKTFWASHMGARGENGQQNHLIEVDERLTKEQGDGVNSTLVMDLTGDGISGNAGTAMESNEEAPSRYSDSVLIGRQRNAVRSDGVLDEQRLPFNMRAVMADKLAYWGARVLLDKGIFRKLAGTTHTDKNSATIGEAAASNSNVIYANGRTAADELTDGDTFNLDLTRRAKTAAMVGSLAGSTIYKLKPYIVGGQAYYVYVDRPESRYVMRNSDDWRNAQLQARERSKDNPIFSGIDGIDDGVLLKFHDLVVTASNGGAGGNLSYTNGLFLGTQAGTVYPAQPAPDWVEKTFDYSEEYGIATGMTQGFDKLRYNSIDFAVICIRSAIPSI